MWEIEYTDEFENWWNTLTVAEQEAINYSVGLLRRDGPALRYPHSKSIKGSHYAMRELRSQCNGRPLRTFYAFDPRRNAILLIGGDKTGNKRFYIEMIPDAEKIFVDHLKTIAEENNENT